jgi:putative inorganic carbon (HCO3(-)) transporter
LQNNVKLARGTDFMALVLQWDAMLQKLGIDSPLQLAITVCVIGLVIITTLGSSGGAPPIFFLYRTLLLGIGILCAIGCRRSDWRIAPTFIVLITTLLLLMLASVLGIPGSHFEGFYLWYRYAFFAFAFINLANYARYQSARWKALLLGTVVMVGAAYLVPDLITRHDRVYGFSLINGDYFATYLLIGVAAGLAGAIYAVSPKWRLLCAAAGVLLIFGIIRTASRGATLAAIAMFFVAAIRARERIPRHVWLFAALVGLTLAVTYSPDLIFKFLDRNQSDPYNYARISIWKSSLDVIAEKPLLGVGFGQFVHISKRFSFPVEGQVARYLKRIGMAHSEYLQHMAETGVPAALLLFGLLGYLMFQVWKRTATAWAENRCFHEAAILTAIGVAAHALVDNCWTIPVTAASLTVVSLADPLPLTPRKTQHQWRRPEFVLVAALTAVIYVHSLIIPGLGLYYNDLGHQAFDKDDLTSAQRLHKTALEIVPDHPVFLDNLGMVYLHRFLERREPQSAELARTYFDRAIAASPRALEPRLHMEAALIRSMTGDDKIDTSLHKAILENDVQLLAIDPYLPFPRKNLAGAYYSLGHLDQAFAEMQRAIDYEPNYVPAYLVMASWYAERGDRLKSDRYNAIGLAIVNKYRNFKPKEVYEGILLGRPEPSTPNMSLQ